MNDKPHMAELHYSPPFMPLDIEAREIWTILVELGFDPVRIIKYEPHKSLTFVYRPCPNSVLKVEKTIDLSWAFRDTDGVALPLVRKVFKENEDLLQNSGSKP